MDAASLISGPSWPPPSNALHESGSAIKRKQWTATRPPACHRLKCGLFRQVYKEPIGGGLSRIDRNTYVRLPNASEVARSVKMSGDASIRACSARAVVSANRHDRRRIGKASSVERDGKRVDSNRSTKFRFPASMPTCCVERGSFSLGPNSQIMFGANDLS